MATTYYDTDCIRTNNVDFEFVFLPRGYSYKKAKRKAVRSSLMRFMRRKRPL